MARVGAEEAEGLFAYRVDHVARELGGLVGGVGVAVEVGAHLMSEAPDGRLGVDGCAAVVEVDAYSLLGCSRERAGGIEMEQTDEERKELPLFI